MIFYKQSQHPQFLDRFDLAGNTDRWQVTDIKAAESYLKNQDFQRGRAYRIKQALIR